MKNIQRLTLDAIAETADDQEVKKETGAFGNYKIGPQIDVKNSSNSTQQTCGGKLRKLMRIKSYIYLTNLSLNDPTNGL